MVQAMCDEVRGRGYRRVILLGREEDPIYTELKGRLVRSGIMVFTPGSADRAWIASLMRGPEAIDADGFGRLRTLLADGIEHGVEAIIVSEDTWVAPIRSVVGVSVLGMAKTEGEDA